MLRWGARCVCFRTPSHPTGPGPFRFGTPSAIRILTQTPAAMLTINTAPTFKRVLTVVCVGVDCRVLVHTLHTVATLTFPALSTPLGASPCEWPAAYVNRAISAVASNAVAGLATFFAPSLGIFFLVFGHVECGVSRSSRTRIAFRERMHSHQKYWQQERRRSFHPPSGDLLLVLVGKAGAGVQWHVVPSPTSPARVAVVEAASPAVRSQWAQAPTHLTPI